MEFEFLDNFKVATVLHVIKQGSILFCFKPLISLPLPLLFPLGIAIFLFQIISSYRIWHIAAFLQRVGEGDPSPRLDVDSFCFILTPDRPCKRRLGTERTKKWRYQQVVFPLTAGAIKLYSWWPWQQCIAPRGCYGVLERKAKCRRYQMLPEKSHFGGEYDDQRPETRRLPRVN
jgi:hypothetical protein